MVIRESTRRDAGRSRAHKAMRRLRNPGAAVRAAEATTLIVMSAALQKWVPMPRWSRLLGEPQPVPPGLAGRSGPVPIRPGSAAERRIAAAVGRAQRLLPFSPTCLAQATAGQVMLRRRGESGTVVLGLLPPSGSGAEADDRPDLRRWGVHAWLLGSAGALTGGAAADGFTPTNVFRDSEEDDSRGPNGPG